MKLCSFESGGRIRPGRIDGDHLIDLGGVPGLPDTLLALIAAGPDALAAAAKAGGPAIGLESVTLRAPVAHPGKVMGIGLNYLDHVRETGREPPAHQIWFNKQRTCIIGPQEPIRIPTVSDMVDYEGELALVIGRRCRNVPAARAHEVIAGYMIGNDVTARDWQQRAPTMTLGKSFDSHGPTGPFLVTPDEIGDPQDLRLRTWVNGEARQDASTGEMIFKIAEQIETLTTVFTLEPGDILFTGTPAGVGIAMDPKGFLRPGDRVRIEIDGLGVLENPVEADTRETLIG